jgi:hypothetical protein
LKLFGKIEIHCYSNLYGSLGSDFGLAQTLNPKSEPNLER